MFLKFLLLLQVFLFLFLGFFLGLHLGLSFSELVKNVLVMKNRMREFILEVLLVKEIGNSLTDKVNSQNLIDTWSLCWINLKHQVEKIGNVVAKVGWNFSIFTCTNLLCKLMKTLRVERWLECAHFIEENTKGPDVRLE